MSTLAESRERLGQTLEEAKALEALAGTEARELSDEEKTRIGELLTEHETLLGDVKRMERLAAAEEATRAIAERRTEPMTPGSPEHATEPRIEFPRYTGGQLRAFKARRGETDREAQSRAYRSGMWIAATLFGNTRAAAWCHDHGMQVRAQKEGTNKLGGFLAPDEMEQAIIDLREEYGAFRKECRVHPMASDHVIVARRASGLTAYAVNENTDITESTKNWNQVGLTAHKWGVFAKYSTELAEDAIISIADDLTDEIAYAFAEKTDDCAMNGDGTSTYHGVVGFLVKMIDGNHAASYYTAEGAANTIDIFTEITATTLAGVLAKCPAYALPNAKWHCSSVAKALVFDRLMMAASGNAARDMAGNMPMAYGGYPIAINQKLPAGAATDYSAKIMLLFGNMRKSATLGDRRGVSIKTSAERFIESDQMAIVGTTRFDINIHDIGDDTDAGPVVGLLGN